MKKIFMFLTSLLFLFILGGCENSLDIPEIEGVYSKSNISDTGELLSKKDVIIKKIGKNRYSININQFNVFNSLGKANISQDFEVIEVKKDREKIPMIYKLKITPLEKGTGFFDKGEKKSFDSVVINEFEFYPKTSQKKDQISANVYLLGSNSSIDYNTDFYLPKNK